MPSAFHVHQRAEKTIGAWLKLQDVHIFVRPLMSNVVFLDLDKFPASQETFEHLVRLQPRAIVETSPGNLQAWLTLPKASATDESLIVTQALCDAFSGDQASVKHGQQGRFPGSTNAKDGKGCFVKMTHACFQNMDEEIFLKITKAKSFSLRDGQLHVRSEKVTAKASEQHKGPDRSAQDCMSHR